MPVDLHVEGHVATILLNDPRRRNAMTPELGDELRAVVARVNGDPDVRAVVLAGEGGVFSAGGDLEMLRRLRAMPRPESRAFMLDFYRRYLSILDLEVPTIAAIEGAAIGAGLCVALACDLVVVEDDAKLALNFVQLGLHPGMGATHLVARRVGPEKAAELLLTGRRFDGREAAAMRLALASVPRGEARARAQALAEDIARNAPLAVRGVRRGMRVDRAALEAALEHEAEQQSISYATDDLGEGLAASAEKRAPRFSGK